MKSFLENRWVLLALRLLVGGAFCYAGAIKIQNPQQFADSIASFKMLPSQLINLMALFLPPFEIVAGCLLIWGRTLRIGSLAILLLCGAFAIALGQALARGLVVDCGCFGGGAPSIKGTWISLGRDILMIAAVLWVRMASKPEVSINHNSIDRASDNLETELAR